MCWNRKEQVTVSDGCRICRFSQWGKFCTSAATLQQWRPPRPRTVQDFPDTDSETQLSTIERGIPIQVKNKLTTKPAEHHQGPGN